MQAAWFVLGLVLGGTVAAVVTWLVTQSRSRPAAVVARSDLALAAARAADAQQALAAVTVAADALRRDLAVEQQQRAALAATLAGETDNLQRQTDATRAAVTEAGRLTVALSALRQQHAGVVATLDAERVAVAEQRAQIVESNRKLHESFAALSADALKHNREDFLATAAQQFKTLQTEAAGALDTKKAEMGELLTPMRQTLDEYRSKLETIEQTRASAYVDIKEHLAAVGTTQQLLSTKTEQLVSALRKPQGRGQWGELTLRRLFELAGLTEHVTFEEQVVSADGRLRPDCVVHLAGGRQVIVDSKCVLEAFLDAAECPDDAGRAACIERHARQVRSRVADLSGKAYWDSFEKATDYVILFLPGEAFLYAAVETDPTLIEDAMNQRVIVASPTTLLGLLRVIEHGWQHRAIEQNAQDIREVGSRLYARVAKVAEHLDKLGRAIRGVGGAYNDAVGSLERNVITTAREMAKLGVPTKSVTLLPAEEVVEDVRSLRPSAWKGLPTVVMVEDVDTVDG